MRPGRPELTPREREIRDWSRGLSNREIATALVVEESMIRTHVKQIPMKLELRTRIQILIFAYETGMSQPAQSSPPRCLACEPSQVRKGGP